MNLAAGYSPSRCGLDTRIKELKHILASEMQNHSPGVVPDCLSCISLTSDELVSVERKNLRIQGYLPEGGAREVCFVSFRLTWYRDDLEQGTPTISMFTVTCLLEAD